MTRVWEGVIFIFVLALAVCFAFPVRVQAVQKVKDVSAKEHKSVHGLLGAVKKKFGKDQELSALIKEYHQLEHQEHDAYNKAAGNPGKEAMASLSELKKETHESMHAWLDFVEEKHPADKDIQVLMKFFHTNNHQSHSVKDKLLRK